MADVLAFNLCRSVEPPRGFRRPDLSTKLKLLGVNVASFGDYFADRDGPQEAMESPGIKALSYKDPFDAVYKKYLFTADGKYLVGGMIIGDTRDYIKLVGMAKSKKALEVPPSRFILGAKQDGEDDNPDDLYVPFLPPFLPSFPLPLRSLVTDRTTPRFARATTSPRETSAKWSRRAPARASARSSPAQRPVPGAEVACPSCSRSSTPR